MMSKRYDKFEFDGHEYNLKPLPITKKNFRKKGMFEKDHVTFELVLFCLGSVTLFAALMIALMKWVG
jgi:hypothetical protein